jgi:Subtilase family
MTARIRHIAPSSLAAILAGLALGAVDASASVVVVPLPSSDYGVHAVCSRPGPGHAGCLSLKLVPRTAEARAHSHPIGVAHGGRLVERSPAELGFGLRPADLHSGYELPPSAPSKQTIALVDAYNDPTAAADLKAYSEEFGLPELPSCVTDGGSEAACFKQVNEYGSAAPESLPFPKTKSELETAFTTSKEEAKEAYGWGIEISLDIETAHATCESCGILLVEAKSTKYSDFEEAERTAATLGATEISNSWGGPEPGVDTAFQHPGIVVTASAGDDGYLNWDSSEPAEEHYADFPAASPHVIAVGGTRLELESDGSWGQETVWNGDGAGGGGCSEDFPAPAWQQQVADWSTVDCGTSRAVADVSADADPYTGLAVRDSSPGDGNPEEECSRETTNYPHWCTIGGTSLASPLIASVFALAGGAGGVEYPARTLYENEVKDPTGLHDITFGSNGECPTQFNQLTGLSECTPTEEAQNSGCANEAICLAVRGYDGPTGLGTPHGIDAFKPTGEAPSSGKGGGSGGSGGGSEEGGSSGNPPSEKSTGSTSGSPSAAATAAPAPTSVASNPAAQLTTLALTVKAIVALDNTRPKISQIGFAFTITASTSVRLTLAKQVRVHRHTRWKTIGRSLTGYANVGRNIWSLRGRGSLGVGVYRITLTPAHAPARSLTFQIG